MTSSAWSLGMSDVLPGTLQTAVLGESEDMPEGSVPVRGYDFGRGVVDMQELVASLATTGFQARAHAACVHCIQAG